jgi:poly-gamma-glutamate capsule biosynthesis protein CapA/YwtB (metallophosphatase superfamily)
VTQTRISRLQPALLRSVSYTLYIALSILSSSSVLSQEISITVVGDIMFGPDVSRIMDREGSLAPFSGAVQFLRDADITFGVLEGGIGTRGEPLQDKEHTFRSKPSAARGLANAGFDVVSLANPHIMDYGEEGFLDTLEFLSWYGVKYVGGGMNIEAARKPLVLTAKGVKVAFLAYYRGSQFDQSLAGESKPGPAFPVYGELEQDVAAAKSQADLVVVSIHWGIQIEDREEVTSRQKLYAQKLIDSGVDVVIGQWLHKLQGIEIYKSKPIIYSLGDFIYGTYAKKVPIGFILRFVFSHSKLLRIEIIPVSTSDAKTGSYFPVVLRGQAAQDAITTLSRLSSDLGTNIQINDDIGIVHLAGF